MVFFIYFFLISMYVAKKEEVGFNNLKPICNIRLYQLIKILASILPMVPAILFYHALKHGIGGLGVDFD